MTKGEIEKNERELALLVYPQNGHNSQGRARPRPGVWNSIQDAFPAVYSKELDSRQRSWDSKPEL